MTAYRENALPLPKNRDPGRAQLISFGCQLTILMSLITALCIAWVYAGFRAQPPERIVRVQVPMPGPERIVRVEVPALPPPRCQDTVNVLSEGLGRCPSGSVLRMEPPGFGGTVLFTCHCPSPSRD